MSLRRGSLVLLVSAALLAVHCVSPEREVASIPAFIPERLERIDAAIQKSIEAGEIPGAVALLALNGEVVYHQAFGLADMERKTPMDRETIFRIASMSKAITSVGVMILYERGHFLLSDPVSDYLPEFRSPSLLVKTDGEGNVLETTQADGAVTILHLLTHTSGISYPFINNEIKGVYEKAGLIDGMTARPLLLRDQMQILAQQPLLHEPGERFTYGLGTDLLGHLCEVISGRPFDEFLADEVFRPLGMGDTFFYVPEEKAGRLATLYAVDDEGVLQVSKGDEADIFLDDPRYPVAGARSYFSGGAGLSSTALDYARFLQMVLNEGQLDGERVLSRKSVEFLVSPRATLGEAQPPRISAAFYVGGSPGEEGKLTSAGTYGWGGAFYTSYFVDPRENMIGVFMSQARPVRTSVGDRFEALAYQALR